MKNSDQFCLHIVSPIHIGCDEVYEPTAFVIDEKESILIHFDPLDLLRRLSSQEKKVFTDLCRKGTISSILEIYKFIRSKRSLVCGSSSVGVCPGLIQTYEKTLSIAPHDTKRIQQELNNFTIARTAFNANSGRPFIPGSSIKGALRTAYLNHCATRLSLSTPQGRGAARELEKKLLDGGSFETDPFRMLKISDFMPVGEVGTQILFAVNCKKKPSKFEPKGPYQILEVIQPGAVFIGSLSVLKPEDGSRIRTPLALDALMTSAQEFFSKELDRENNELHTIGTEPAKIPKSHGSTGLRVGRHSGAECVTVEGHRDIRIMLGGRESRSDKNATTLWLASTSGKPSSNAKLKPFGWTMLEPMTEETMETLKRLEDGSRRLAQLNLREQAGASSGILEVRTISEGESGLPAKKDLPSLERWDKATLAWRPNDQTIVATAGTNRALGKGKELVPESLHEKFFIKKKAVAASVTVERVGNAFRIVKIDPLV